MYRPNFATALGNLGIVVSERGRPEEGVAFFRRAVEAEPDGANQRANHLSNLGLALVLQGEFAEAAEHVRRAAELEPEEPKHPLLLGDFLERLGRQAEAAFRQVLHLKPEWAEVHCHLGEALFRTTGQNLSDGG